MKTLTHPFRLDLPAGVAFLLFTPKGEEAWVPGWEPRYLSPGAGRTEAAMVFTTQSDDGEVVWTCLDYRPDECRARYFRVVPGLQASLVDVGCVADGEEASTVTVSYTHFPLSEAGRRAIDAVTETDFARGIDGWKDLIEAARAAGRI